MKIAITGTVGVPARYGGFETLVEKLVCHAQASDQPIDQLTVYCSKQAYEERPSHYCGARLRYSRLNANGIQSIIYDCVAALDAIWRRHDRLLVLGVSGAIIFPLLRLISRARIVTNVDGIEWRRPKWTGLGRYFLKWSEWLAVRFAHEVIADNQGIADYLKETYKIEARVIAYGGDHAVQSIAEEPIDIGLIPDDYALALCRIEPENNVAMILEAFENSSLPLVFVGNWNNSEFGRKLRSQYAHSPNILMLDPIYEPTALQRIRGNASAYIHGHSAGGTNPALVEMMHVGHPILAFDCSFNRYTTEDCAAYFASAPQLADLVAGISDIKNGSLMNEIANRRYRWDVIGAEYFSLLREA
ncbi:DUF1972 domain-containing protein [Qipengyuania gaetbuli]|uniref:DUF1972 domain-containing protein n=1 Tax=Qipengyuania gaetbuli TaxID=266952 RepID=UPI001CD6DEE5|nr:DUF1972 domain-containing protein [Qipengyuania gaetbuli]MCA0911035.1 DUF1972 domain-containing protein [Qipengyuania gaetbuli]